MALLTRAMRTESIVATVDRLLKPLGFMRRNALWNRISAGTVEVVEVQVSKAGDTATINAGVLDADVHSKLWGNEPPTFVETPDCTVEVRVGELIAGTDIWWPLTAGAPAEDAATAVSRHVLPFLTRMQSRQEMVRWLVDTQVCKRRYPRPIINLAILQHFVGNPSEASTLLEEVQKGALGGWRTRAAEVAARLGGDLGSGPARNE